MKNLIVVLAVAFVGILNAQSDLDSLNKLPFNTVANPTTTEDLNTFDLNQIYNLDDFSKLLSERYSCFVGVDQFVDTQGFLDIVIYLRPTNSDVYECSVYTLLSVTENLFKRGILLENLNLYTKICQTTSN